MGCISCNENCSDAFTKELDIEDKSLDKQQIVVIIVAAKSLLATQIAVDKHLEYEISKFLVIEQLKISAKVLKPRVIYQAICNSNANYKFHMNSFVQFETGEKSPLYKKMREVKLDGDEGLQQGKVYYLFVESFEELFEPSQSNVQKSDTSGRFKRINFSWKKKSTKSVESSDNSDRVTLDRKFRYSILNSMQTIKEVDSINTSTFNHSLNTYV